MRQPGPAVEVISHEIIDCLLISKFSFQVVEYKNFQDYYYQMVVVNRNIERKKERKKERKEEEKKIYIYI